MPISEVSPDLTALMHPVIDATLCSHLRWLAAPKAVTHGLRGTGRLDVEHERGILVVEARGLVSLPVSLLAVLVAIGGHLASRAKIQRLSEISLNLTTVVTTHLAKGSGRARLVVLQRSEELHLSRVAEAVVGEGHGVARARVDARDELAQVLHVVVADPGAALHDHGGEDDGVHLAVGDPEHVLLAAEVLEELVAEAGVELVAECGGQELLVGVVLVVAVAGEAHLAFGLAADVEILVALEKACGGWNWSASVCGGCVAQMHASGTADAEELTHSPAAHGVIIRGSTTMESFVGGFGQLWPFAFGASALELDDRFKVQRLPGQVV